MNVETYIIEKSVEGALLERLSRSTSEEKQALSKILSELSPSANTLKIFLTLADEISARDKVTSESVLSEPHLIEILCAEKISKKEKQKKLRVALEERRFPIRKKIQNELEACKKEILKNTGLKVEIPEELEGDSVELTIKARSNEDVQKASQKLSALAEQESLKKIFQILRGELEL